MPDDYPKKYWWVVLIVVPVVLALIQLYPQMKDDQSSPNITNILPESKQHKIDSLASKATEKYWYSMLLIEKRYLSDIYRERNKAFEIIKTGQLSDKAEQCIEYFQKAVSSMREYVDELENIPALNVDQELLNLTTKDQILERKKAAGWERLSSLLMNSKLVKQFNLEDDSRKVLKDTLDELGALAGRSIEMNNEIRLLRIKLMKKYNIDLKLSI